MSPSQRVDPRLIRQMAAAGDDGLVQAILIIAGFQLGRLILLESTLSFLGLGIQPPTPAWGTMLAEGREVFRIAWWTAVFPGLAILITVLGINLLGDGLDAR